MQLEVHDSRCKPPNSVLLTLIAPGKESTSTSPEDIQLSLPQTFPRSRGGHASPFIGTPEREEYWCRRNGAPMNEYGQLLVDEAPCVDQSFNGDSSNGDWAALRSLCKQDLGVCASAPENWTSCYLMDPYGRNTGEVELRGVVYISFTLLATSFICRVLPWTGIGPHSPLIEPIPVDLVRARLRTKSSILDELCTRISRGESKYISHLAFHIISYYMAFFITLDIQPVH